MSFAMICPACGKPMKLAGSDAEQSGQESLAAVEPDQAVPPAQAVGAAGGGDAMWRCEACGAETVHATALMGTGADSEQMREQFRDYLQRSLAAGQGELQARLLPVRLALALIAAGAIGILAWLVSRSTMTTSLSAAAVVALWIGWSVLDRAYLAPKRIDDWVDRMLKKQPWEKPHIRG